MLASSYSTMEAHCTATSAKCVLPTPVHSYLHTTLNAHLQCQESVPVSRVYYVPQNVDLN